MFIDGEHRMQTMQRWHAQALNERKRSETDDPTDEAEIEALIGQLAQMRADLKAMYKPDTDDEIGAAEIKTTIVLLREIRAQIRARFEAKSIMIDIKASLQEGEFEGLAAVYGNKDEMGDIIDRGAFAGAPHALPLLFNHQHLEMPLGLVTLMDTPEGLRVHGKLNLAVGKAKEVWALVKQGVIRGLSIGFTTLRHRWEGTTRHIEAARLYEISLTPFPANPAALVHAVKAHRSSGVGDSLGGD